MNAIELSLFSARLTAICEEMSAVLRRSAFSPNIRDRRDYSCALFSAKGELIAQSSAIPVHLGSMAYAIADVVKRTQNQQRNDTNPQPQLVFNDPFKGGTHLPDVTVALPVYAGQECIAWAVNRAHHADIGSPAPGSMPLSQDPNEEGLCISPSWFTGTNDPEFTRLTDHFRHRQTSNGDFSAQFSANRVAARRLSSWLETLGAEGFVAGHDAVAGYAMSIAEDRISEIPDGVYTAEDVMDDDGFGTKGVRIHVSIRIDGPHAEVDLSGSDDQVAGNINCPPSVAFAAAYFVFRCLMPAHTPDCAGAMRPITLKTRTGSVVDPAPPAPVAAGNVETSSRIVDTVLQALQKALPDLPACSQGTMNNLAMGGDNWAYYETLAGGHGGQDDAHGATARHANMTNTLNTPIEVAERHFPVRIERYATRAGSGGNGRFNGGDGIVREYRFLEPCQFTLLAERHRHAPPGTRGGTPGKAGMASLNGVTIPGKCQRMVAANDVLRIETPGGGGWGTPNTELTGEQS